MHTLVSSLLITVAVFTDLSSCGFGARHGQYGSENAQNAANEIRQNENVAQRSAQSAVASAVGRDYANQLDTTAQFASQFTAPVTKSQAQSAFNAVMYQQQASLISAALANAAPAIRSAADSASKSNFQQAYADAEGSRAYGNLHDAQEREQMHLTGNTVANQLNQASQAAHYRDQQRTQQTQTSAAALQAIQGISNVNRDASYGK